MAANNKHNGGDAISIHDNISDLGKFKLKRVLSDLPDTKMAFLEAEVEGSKDPAVIILEKLPFKESVLMSLLSGDTSAEQQMTNDIYGQYLLQAPPSLNLIKSNIIHPATEKHISKYQASPGHLVVETPELYHGVTLPFIESEKFSLEWVYNILDHKKEADRIIYEDPDPDSGFILAMDFKWSGKQVEDMYCLAIVHKRGIKSLRDLNASHLPLLRNIASEGSQALSRKYNIPSSRLRAFIHYQPSYYHLHIHFTYLGYRAPGINCEKSHMLDTVISNLEMDENYYRNASLPFVVYEKDKLYGVYEAAGYFTQTNTSISCSMVDTTTSDILSMQTERKIADLTNETDKLLDFFAFLGRAKHESSGEHWVTTYGESAWRMAVMSICLPEHVDRKRLISLSLVSGFTCFGKTNDENTQWEQKVDEVKGILRDLLPSSLAGRLVALFEEHSCVRRGRLDGSKEHMLYRFLLEFEEFLLRWEEMCKETEKDQRPSVEPLIAQMAKVGFPGTDKLKLFNDNTVLVKTLAFIMAITKLQRLKRTGWVNNKVRDPETVAGHMYRMGVMGLLFSFTSSSSIRDGDAAVISICHDIAECIIGDITPHCKMSPEEKEKKEMAAFLKLVEHLPETAASDLITAFRRYENQRPGDMDAMLTKDYDKFDMIMQAYEYEKAEKRGPFLQQFFDSTMDVFQTKLAKKWQEDLLQRRAKLLEQMKES